ncbi:TetR/AcrR family transcriptional regulator [Sphingomonas jatrophae]|uniref:Transcriptional regulator, TetR family n=1 Tax=Sphingomonas jatrophae TaxID=1166337 RepID=A0A1I6KBP4_9SPHN|nr:TetR/AcrR family transcriptional regulator [Sphingomonas jatrophae]SFR88637.1 transcriptional regulator, TetR family [Sphingomonas jatrophae]
MADPPPTATPKRGRRGRPKLLDPAQIRAATLAMLAEGGLEGFTMNKLAQRLSASVMTLYTYFPSREALLSDAASSIFNSFEAPDETLDWRAATATWLHELRRMFVDHPVGLRLIKWDGAITPSWLKVWMPLLRILTRAGLSGPDLLIAANWTGRVAMALLMARIAAQDEAVAIRHGTGRESDLSGQDRALIETLSGAAQAEQGDRLYAFGVANILDGLTRLIAPDHPLNA